MLPTWQLLPSPWHMIGRCWRETYVDRFGWLKLYQTIFGIFLKFSKGVQSREWGVSPEADTSLLFITNLFFNNFVQTLITLHSVFPSATPFFGPVDELHYYYYYYYQLTFSNSDQKQQRA